MGELVPHRLGGIVIPLLLSEALETLASLPRVLVACDYDGTIAEIVDDPQQAHPRPDALEALRRLHAHSGTHVAVVSGRARADLAQLSGLGGIVQLIGSHGAEWDDGHVLGLEPHMVDVIDELGAGIERIATTIPGVRLEHKPAAVAVHMRAVTMADRVVLDAELDLLARRFPDIREQRGLLVREFGVATWDKGMALDRLRGELAADAVLFIGDDLTDEHAFARLRTRDVGVKVGNGATAAAHRVADPAAVAMVLGAVAHRRQQLTTP